MKYINLSIKKDRFRKELLDYGFNLDIINYSGLIDAIQDKIREDVFDFSKLDNYKDSIEFMFKNRIPSILAINELENFKYITEEYFKKIISSGIVDSCVEYIDEDFSDKLMENAFQKKYFEFLCSFAEESIVSDFVSEQYQFYFKNTLFERKSNYIIEHKLIRLSMEKKEDIINETLFKAKKFILKNMFWSDYYSEYIVGHETLFSLLFLHDEDVDKIIPFFEKLIFSDSFKIKESIKEYPSLNLIQKPNVENEHINLIVYIEDSFDLSCEDASKILKEIFLIPNLSEFVSNVHNPINWNVHDWPDIEEVFKLYYSDILSLKKERNKSYFTQFKYKIDFNNEEFFFTLYDLKKYLDEN